MMKANMGRKSICTVALLIVLLGALATPVQSQDLSNTIPLDGRTIKYVVDTDGFQGAVYVDNIKINEFQWKGTNPLSGTIAIRRYDKRNFSIDNLRIAQTDSAGTETVVFTDDFNRDTLGDKWTYAALGEGDANPDDIAIFENELLSEAVGGTTIDAIAYPNLNLVFAGKKTVFEFTLVSRWDDTANNPGVIIGTKQFGLLFEMNDDANGYPIASSTWGRNNDAWSGDMGIYARTFDKIEQYRNEGLLPVEGKRFRYVIEPDALNGTLIIAGFKIGTFTWLNAPLDGAAGGFGFRRYDTRNSKIDDVRLTQIDAQGNETVLFTDDFNRTELGEKWNPIPLDSAFDPNDYPIENGVLVSTNASGNQVILFPNVSFSFEGKTTIFEFTLIERSSDLSYNPGLVIGTDVDGLLVEYLEQNGLPGIEDTWGRLGGAWVSGVGTNVVLEEFEKVETNVTAWMLQ